MRIIQTVNDTIRLLFNPKTEIFCLSDFLLVRDYEENFLGQVVEIFDDKFDQEANVAKIRLVYRIVNGGELAPYDNYTPSRECEVAKIKQSEIEKCINLNRKTIEIGTSSKTHEQTKINTDFFENKCVVFADKFEQTNRLFEVLAPKFAIEKPVLILDFSGTCSPSGCTSYVAGGDFKMPLSYDTIDYIQQKTLMHARLETQVVLGDIFEEIKKYLSDEQTPYISLPNLIKTVQRQCKITPSAELLVLISWLKKYLRAGIFAKNKKEFEPVIKSFKKNKITVVDLSDIKSDWQKEFFDYLINQISDDIYLLTRLNDNNINNDILNFVYLKKKNISFIPSFAYGYKKASYIMDFARNYILMPTLNPKRDFTYANFQIQSLNNDSFMLFGRDTKDFIFVVENPAAARKNNGSKDKEKAFISLNLQLEDMTPFELKPDNFTVRQIPHVKKRLQEEIRLSDVLGEEKPLDNKEQVKTSSDIEDKAPVETIKPEIKQPIETAQPEIEPVKTVQPEIEQPSLNAEILPDTADTDENAQNDTTAQIQNSLEMPIEEDELDYFNIEEDEPDISSKETVIEEIAQNVPKEAEIVQIQEDLTENTETDKNIQPQMPKIKETKDEILTPASEFEEHNENEKTQNTDTLEKMPEQNQDVSFESVLSDIEPKLPDEKENVPSILLKSNGTSEIVKAIEETGGEVATIVNEVVKENSPAKKASKKQNKNKDEKIETKIISDEIEPLTSKENHEIKENVQELETPIALSSTSKEEIISKEITGIKENSTPKEEITPANKTEKASEETGKTDSAGEITEANETDKAGGTSSDDDEIDRKFEEIMSEEKISSKGQGSIKINDTVSLDLEKIKKGVKTPEHKLPIFDDEPEQEETMPQDTLKEGENVFHEKYGEGKIVKVINYGAKTLLQIDFKDVGKRLLDPKIAKLKLTQEIN